MQYKLKLSLCYNFQSLCFKVFFVKLNWSLNITLKKLNWTFDRRRNDSFWKIMKNCAKYDRRHLWWEIIIIVNKKIQSNFVLQKEYVTFLLITNKIQELFYESKFACIPGVNWQVASWALAVVWRSPMSRLRKLSTPHSIRVK